MFGKTLVQLKLGFSSWKDCLRVDNGVQDEPLAMIGSVNTDENSIFKQPITVMKINSIAFISGTFGVGKS
ncbi:hypothetical protein RO3G_14048 [Rhizopus delemar RA 99-880]|uniref:Uncharacterized protein n=1 Tax=Rhizopus delemar (strain RA 99-880 / ATCC MYA-4621 / FGSC 9543 / NRRL 43880) TaxID=246409 RepID=I1CLK7_RHIO9|nr:hypothetical protein RO3G_14048 [Rhizopus delemar RA 99-880]|eukprot:EIE89337.1 hypothetical protein RO3G_14048 [Rhizopus delemar RA 99-880]